MKYHFDVSEKRQKIVLPTNLIGKALEEAQKVQPAEGLKLAWEGQIYRDIEANQPSNWRQFINSLIP